jgi:hypothetical protein
LEKEVPALIEVGRDFLSGARPAAETIERMEAARDNPNAALQVEFDAAMSKKISILGFFCFCFFSRKFPSFGPARERSEGHIAFAREPHNLDVTP